MEFAHQVDVGEGACVEPKAWHINTKDVLLFSFIFRFCRCRSGYFVLWRAITWSMLWVAGEKNKTEEFMTIIRSKMLLLYNLYTVH